MSNYPNNLDDALSLPIATNLGIPDANSTTKGVIKLTNDLGGTADSPTVVGIQNRSVDSTAPTNNQVLAWSSGSNHWTPTTISGGGAVPDATNSVKGILKLTNDLGGTADLPSVVAIQGFSISTTAPSDGYALVWNNLNSEWEPSEIISSVADADLSTKGILQLANDLGGTAALPKVIGIQGRSVQDVSPNNADALVWDNLNSRWSPTAIVQLAGDLGGTTSLPTVIGLQGFDVNSTSPNSNEVLAWDGVNSYWKPTAVTTLIPDAGSGVKGLIEIDSDLGGTASSPKVVAIQNRAIQDVAPNDGEVLTWDNLNSRWYPAVSSGSVPDADASTKGKLQLTGDLGGTAASPIVTGLQGNLVTSTAPNNGEVLTWDGVNSYWEPAYVTTLIPDASSLIKGLVQLSNDLGGTATSPLVTGLQGYDVANTAPSDNYVLTWNNTNTRWEPTDISSVIYVEPLQQISEMINASGISSNGGLASSYQTAFDITIGSMYLPSGFYKPIIGIKFYWAGTLYGALNLPHTIRGRLYVTSSGTHVAEGTVSVSTDGTYTITFGTPYTLSGTDARNYIYVGLYNTTTKSITGFSEYTAIPATNLGDHTSSTANTIFQYAPGLTHVKSKYGSGEVKPTIDASTERYAVDLLYSV